jgi:hypothetical protein
MCTPTLFLPFLSFFFLTPSAPTLSNRTVKKLKKAAAKDGKKLAGKHLILFPEFQLLIFTFIHFPLSGWKAGCPSYFRTRPFSFTPHPQTDKFSNCSIVSEPSISSLETPPTPMSDAKGILLPSKRRRRTLIFLQPPFQLRLFSSSCPKSPTLSN